MQKKAPLTPKSRRVNRSVMAPPDLSSTATGSTGNHRLPSCRHSVMPSVPSILDMTRKSESENKDAELKHLYNTYLRSEAMVLLVKKKAEGNEKTIVSQLATLMKEDDAIKRELLSIETRERDLKSSTKLQNDLDKQLVEITACLSYFDEKPVQVLNRLQSILESLDVLKCDTLIIPKTRDEMDEILDRLNGCKSLLISINETIGSKRDALITVNKGLKDFNKTYVDIRVTSEKCREALQELQILVLKEGADSMSLAQSGDRNA